MPAAWCGAGSPRDQIDLAAPPPPRNTTKDSSSPPGSPAPISILMPKHSDTCPTFRIMMSRLLLCNNLGKRDFLYLDPRLAMRLVHLTIDPASSQHCPMVRCCRGGGGRAEYRSSAAQRPGAIATGLRIWEAELELETAPPPRPTLSPLLAQNWFGRCHPSRLKIDLSRTMMIRKMIMVLVSTALL